MRGSAFKPDMKAVRRKAEKAKEEAKTRKSRGKSEYFRFDEGRTVLRVLPPWSEKAARAGEVFKRVAFYKSFPQIKVTHWGLCGEETDPDKYDECPIRKVILDLKDKGVQVKNQFGGWGFAQRRVMFNALVYEDPEHGRLKKPKLVIVDAPASIGDILLTSLADPDVGDFTDIRNGFNLTITRTDGDKTDYTHNWARKDTPIARSRANAEKILEKMPNLDLKFNLTDEVMAEQKDIAKKLAAWGKEQIEDLPDDDDEYSDGFDEIDDEKPKRKKSSRKKSTTRKRRTRSSDDEDETPRRRRKKTTTKKRSAPAKSRKRRRPAEDDDDDWD